MKLLIGLAFVTIVASLFSALFFLMKDRDAKGRTVRALTLRIGLSIALFLFILLAWRLGWIEANGVQFKRAASLLQSQYTST
ncbi:twin transmembrane helix small protein [Derxia lacustris]|uniref:twin transmembrane helix small protein n=1 Tax=Derxia lacustris TaxID=764842 RepID=UPI000A1717E6|nr:twin transmembrane helix small protein [Derxia lacustris]